MVSRFLCRKVYIQELIQVLIIFHFFPYKTVKIIRKIITYLLSNIVGQQCFFNFGRDHLSVEILRQSRHFVDAGRHVLVQIPQRALLLRNRRVGDAVRALVGLFHVLLTLEADGVVRRNARWRQEHGRRRRLRSVWIVRVAQLEGRWQEILRLLHLVQ